MSQKQFTPIKLNTKKARPIVQLTFPEYRGRKFMLKFTFRLEFYDTNWSGGTVNKYKFVRYDGNVYELYADAPWRNQMEGKTVQLPEGVLAVCHSYSMGKDMGITIYANPMYAPKELMAGEKHD